MLNDNLKNQDNNEEVKLTSLTEQLKDYLRLEIIDEIIWRTFFLKMNIIDLKDNIATIYFPLEQESTLTLLQHQELKEPLEKAIKEILGEKIIYKLTIKNKDLYQKEIKEEEKKINSKNITKDEKKRLINNYKPDYTFENYMKDGFNKDIVEFCESLINKENNIFRVYISGSSGIGKTHLLNAIGNSFKNKGKKGLYISPHSFSREISNLILENNVIKISNIINYLCSLDLVLFDDFQIFGEGKKSQTKIFIYQIIDGRMLADKLTVFASELDLNDLENLFENKITTRIRDGFIGKIKKPNENEMYNLLKFVLNKENFDFSLLDENSKQFIIKNHFSSIRALLGAAKRLSFSKSKILNANYVYDVVKKIFEDVVREQVEINPDTIIKTVSKYYRISEKEIYGSSRKKEIVIARHIAIILVNSLLTLSSTEIGKIFKKDHTTILNALKKFNNENYDKSIQETIDLLSREIRGFK
ncbi:chromosomal replication initiator protein [Mycoplasmopsis mustelae]|uniref:Chromosomal replication initiator protein DnaA n=1 Tax=Mycoplasmopsis mustelae TaxID=171289 RepID=A0A4R7UD63_9BACT|nr:DnaA/Hda family protein [Mycoplasmopsis mustelae]TDV24397.1 chromosomal replication initiator protein [Mycoplasmopsis mustelae]